MLGKALLFREVKPPLSQAQSNGKAAKVLLEKGFGEVATTQAYDTGPSTPLEVKVLRRAGGVRRSGVSSSPQDERKLLDAVKRSAAR